MMPAASAGESSVAGTASAAAVDDAVTAAAASASAAAAFAGDVRDGSLWAIQAETHRLKLNCVNALYRSTV